MHDRHSPEPVVVWTLRGAGCLLFGLCVTLLTARCSLVLDDPFSGVGYRGVPKAFLKRPPKWEPAQEWRVHWSPLAFDALFWATPGVGFFLFRDRIRTRRSARWAAQGKCGRCGYDLQGSPDRRCSECGTIVPEFS